MTIFDNSDGLSNGLTVTPVRSVMCKSCNGARIKSLAVYLNE